MQPGSIPPSKSRRQKPLPGSVLKCSWQKECEGLAEATIIKRRWFIKLVFPVLGKRPISEIQPKAGRHESAKRARLISLCKRFGSLLHPSWRLPIRP